MRRWRPRGQRRRSALEQSHITVILGERALATRDEPWVKSPSAAGFRLGVIKTWNLAWFEDKNERAVAP